MNRAKLILVYKGKDISKDIASFVESFSYTDHEGGKADDLQVRLEDRDDLLKQSWFPAKGTMLTAFIEKEANGKKTQLSCGTFAIDDIQASGPPDVVTLKAVSSLTVKALKREKNSQAWENITFQTLVDSIGKKHGLNIFYSVDLDIHFVRVEQREESDLAFLKRICDDNDLNLKISGEKIIVMEGKKLENAAPVFSIVRCRTALAAYSFTSKTYDIYRACQIQYWTPDKKELKTHTFTPPDPPTVGQVYKINRRVESLASAIKRAKHSLRKKNKKEVKATFDLMGHTLLLGGLTGMVSGWGNFDGKYIIDEATHSQGRRSGYRTGLTLRRVVNF